MSPLSHLFYNDGRPRILDVDQPSIRNRNLNATRQTSTHTAKASQRPAKSSMSSGAIGGVVVGILCLILFIGLIGYYRQRKSKREKAGNGHLV